jgi:hypothetical protein
MLFEAADSYRGLLKSAPMPILATDVHDQDHIEQRAVSEWFANNGKAIERATEAQNRFYAERFALGVICGSILQIAAMSIQLYSKNIMVHPTFEALINKGSKPARYSIGREIRGVPIGLVIYAARNQYNHLDDVVLREPTITVFDCLALNRSDTNQDGTIDPAFDLKNVHISNYASNIVSLLGWEKYEIFEQELLHILQ